MGGGEGADAVEVGEGAIDADLRVVGAGDRRDEGMGAGGEDQAVVEQGGAVGEVGGVAGAVDEGDGEAGAQGDAVLFIPFARGEVEGVGGGAGEVVGEVDAVVGRVGLVADDGDMPRRRLGALVEGGAEFPRDHAAPDDDEAGPGGRGGARELV